MLKDFHIFPQSFPHTTHCPLGSAMSTKLSSDWLRHEKIFFFHASAINHSPVTVSPSTKVAMSIFLCKHSKIRQTKTDRTSAVTKDSLGTQSG